MISSKYLTHLSFSSVLVLVIYSTNFKRFHHYTQVYFKILKRQKTRKLSYTISSTVFVLLYILNLQKICNIV